MPLSVANIIQRNSGSFVGTSGNATLPVATTAGNTVILVIGQSVGLVTPAGFTADDNNSLTTCKGGIYRKSNVGAESSWPIAPSSSAICCWVVYEISGLDLVNPLDTKQAGAMGSGTGATLSTGITPVSSTFDGLIIAMHAARDTTSPTPPTWSGHTGGLVEQVEVGGNDGSASLGLSVSEVYSLSIATWSSTATKTAPVGQGSLAGVVVYSANGAKRAADVLCTTGFEFGTAAGLATGVAGAAGGPIFDSLAGTPAIVSTSPRNGSYCLELSSSAAAENVTWTRNVTLFGSTTQMCARMSFYFPTSLPGSDLVLFGLEPVSGQNVIFRYITASQKIGVKVGTGTEVVSDAVVAVNEWISLDCRIDGRTTTHLCDWKLKYTNTTNWVDQTQASMAGATIPVDGWTVRIGWTASSTGTVRYDDVVVSGVGGHFPLGDFMVLPVGVDPVGSLTLSGTSTNFNTFTSNGTLAAWDATVAHNNIDELPPTLGASADGFCQVATGVSDFVEIPMDTIDAASLGTAIRGVRMVACGWAATTTTAIIQFRSWDGVAEGTLSAFVDRQFDNTSTPGWVCAMVKATVRQDWTQTKLDALAFRIGYTNDASPAIGIHAIYGEVALRVGELIEVGNAEEGLFTAHLRVDPDSSGVIAIIVESNDPTRGCTFSWDILEVTQTPIYVDPNTSHTEVIGATDIATFTSYTMSPDPAD